MSEDSHGIVVRAVEEKDVLAVARLWSEMRLEESRLGGRDSAPPDVGTFRELVERRLGDPSRILLIAHRGGQAVGFYSGRVRGRVGGGLDVYVNSKARRQGVGTSLVQAALTRYAERGAELFAGALRGDRASFDFWESIWRGHPSRLLSTKSAAGVEWRTRSLVLRGSTDSPQANRTRSSSLPSTL
jgi:ribosomal protein S18 acetylase RimI-like enzyme